MHKIFANSLFIGKNLKTLPYCHSTNKVATQMLENEIVPDGTLIITDKQTSGKGQRGNNWESEAGKNLTFSVIFKPRFLFVRDQFYLNMIASLAVAESLGSEIGKEVRVKWPNDIYVGDHKICGILIENAVQGSQIEHAITGIGINVNQLSFTDDKATSMSELTLREYDLGDILEKVVHSLEKYYLKLRSGRFQDIRKEYLRNLYWKNELHLFESEVVFSGRIVDVDEAGRLVIESGKHRSAYGIKEISFVS